MFWSNTLEAEKQTLDDIKKLKARVLEELVFEPTLSYVLTEDRSPIFYADNLVILKKKMWAIAKKTSRNAFFGQARNNIYIHEKNSKEVEVVVKAKNFIFAYDNIFKRFKIHTIPKLEDR